MIQYSQIRRYETEKYLLASIPTKGNPVKETLFVYGTLAPNRPNAHILEEIGGTWQEGIVTGELRSEGWGAQMGYPGIVLDASGNEIAGFLFTSEHLADHWDMLDDFEGVEYQRVITQAKLTDGSIVAAHIYTLR